MSTFSLPILFLEAITKSSRNETFSALAKIGDFKLVKAIQKKGSFNKFTIGEYVDSKGRKAFGKTLVKINKYNTSALMNEVLMYDLLTSVQKDVNHRIPRAIKHIRIPHSFGLRKNKGVISLLIQFIEGTPLVDFSVDHQFEVYEKVVNYLRYLGNNMSSTQKSQIRKRIPLSETVMYPFIVLFSIFSYPKMAETILKGFFSYFKNVGSYLLDRRLVLTHRDLHSKNILIQKDKIFLIDLENMVFTHPDYEYVVSFLASWRNKELSIKTWGLIQNKRIGKVLLIKMATHYLTHRHLPVEKYEDYTQALYWAINTKI